MADLPTAAKPSLLEQVIGNTTFDTDLYHVMDERDDKLIRDEVLNGVTSDIFVYQFQLQGTTVAGISVRGAAHLAHEYGGIQHRVVASTRKTGALFEFKQYPGAGVALSVQAQRISELAGDPDYYEVVVEIKDIKNGNSVQMSKKELRYQPKRDGGEFDRPHFDVIAESKAYRNAVLRLLPQDVIEEFKARALKRKNNTADVTSETIDVKRDGILQYAAKQGIALDRAAVYNMVMAQIAGLSEAARQGIDQFKASLAALGLAGSPVASAQPAQAATQQQGQPAAASPAAPATTAGPAATAEPAKRGRPPKPAAQPPAGQADPAAPGPQSTQQPASSAPAPATATAAPGLLPLDQPAQPVPPPPPPPPPPVAKEPVPADQNPALLAFR